MKIEISQEALKWFQDEVGVEKGEKIKFYAKIYGSSPVQESYSLGFSKDDPIDMAASTEMEGIVFFVEESDLWFFDGHDLHVGYNQTADELEFTYIKP